MGIFDDFLKKKVTSEKINLGGKEYSVKLGII
jgi:hypothetical protein